MTAFLRRIQGGALRVVEAGRAHEFGESDAALRASVTVRDPATWRSLLRGSNGLAGSYARGGWESDDLTALLRLAARNAPKLDRLRERFAFVLRPAQALRRPLTNTRRRSRGQIAAHYDLGNTLFERMLDQRMVYSCALFETPDVSLEEAQVAKLDAVCDKLELSPDDHLLEIGTGWGGLAIHAAHSRGCRVTTATISREQYELASARVREAGLDKRVAVLLRDYRDLTGVYDKLASVEMVEAVGWRNFDRFFAKCSELLAADGLMLLQAITVDDRAYEVEKASASFINTYIFPGGCLPSMEVIASCVSRSTNLRWLSVEDITPHYVLTLRHWRRRFRAAAKELGASGYDERFQRLWNLYLHYCEAGFAERRIGDVQIVLAKPRYRIGTGAGITSAAVRGADP